LGSSGDTLTSIIDYNRQVGITIYPYGQYLDNGTTYTFGFNITASLGNLIGCYFEIYEEETVGESVADASGCTSSPYAGDNISTTYTVQSGDRLSGAYFIKVNASCNDDNECDAGPNRGQSCTVDGDCQVFGIIDADAFWIEANVSAGPNSLKSFFEGLTTLGDFGEGIELDFSRIFWFFLVVTLLLGIFTYATGWEMNSPGSALWLIFPLVAISSMAGFFDIINPQGFTMAGWITKYTVAFICFLVWLGYLANNVRREHLG
jgi:hypothetical protein